MVQPTKIPHLPAPQEEPLDGVKKLPTIRPSASGFSTEPPQPCCHEFPASRSAGLGVAGQGPKFTASHRPSQMPVSVPSERVENPCQIDMRVLEERPPVLVNKGASAGKPSCIKVLRHPEAGAIEHDTENRCRAPPARPSARSSPASPNVQKLTNDDEDHCKPKEVSRTVFFADELAITADRINASRQNPQAMFRNASGTLDTSNNATVGSPSDDGSEEPAGGGWICRQLVGVFVWSLVRVSAVAVPLSTFLVRFPGEPMSQGVAGLTAFTCVVLALFAKSPSFNLCHGDTEGTALVLLELAAAICTATASETASFVAAMSTEERSTLKALCVLARARGFIRSHKMSATVGQAFFRGASRGKMEAPASDFHEAKMGIQLQKTRSFVDIHTERIHRTVSGLSRGVFRRTPTSKSEFSDTSFTDFNIKRSLHRLRRSVTTKSSMMAPEDAETGNQEPFWRFLVDTGLLTHSGWKDSAEPMHSVPAPEGLHPQPPTSFSVPHESAVASVASFRSASAGQPQPPTSFSVPHEGAVASVASFRGSASAGQPQDISAHDPLPEQGEPSAGSPQGRERVKLWLPGADTPIENLDVSSDAGASYCSANDGIDRKLKDVVRMELMNLGPGNGGLTRVQIEFNSACMRTRSIWQQHALKEQQALLEAVSSRLKKNENMLKFGDEVQEEQKELLRGFRKIISRGADEDDEPGAQTKVKITVVERSLKLRQQLQELCQVLDYPCEAFSTLSEARTAMVKQPTVFSSTDGGDSSLTMLKQQSVGSANNAVGSCASSSSVYVADVGLWGDTEDWRPHHLFPSRDRRGKLKATQDSAHLVLLGTSCLTRELPSEWKHAFVSLASYADEFEEVGRTLAAADEKEIRERLRQYGVNDYVLHPISLQSLQGLVRDASMHRFGEDYLLTQLLGSGSMGCVYRAKRLRDGHVFALKQINTKRLTRTAMGGAKMEGDLLRTMRWPTVLFLVDAWLSRKDNIRCLVLPLLDSGSLADRVQAALAKSDEGEPMAIFGPVRAAEWLAQAFHALGYLHWRGVLHRDLKPANMLLAADDRSLHISDFGSALVLPGAWPHPGQTESVPGCGCTPLYASPEGLSQGVHYAASDLWSLGVSFYEVATLKSLFPSDCPPEDLKKAILGFNMTEPSTDPALAGASTEVERELSAMRHSTEGSWAFLGSEITALLQADHRKRPGPAAWLAVRSGTMHRVRDVLESLRAFPAHSRLEAHFEALKRIAAESLEAFRRDGDST